MTGERVPPSRPHARGKSAPTPSSRLVPRPPSSRRRDGRRLRARLASPVSRLASRVSRLSSPVSRLPSSSPVVLARATVCDRPGEKASEASRDARDRRGIGAIAIERPKEMGSMWVCIWMRPARIGVPSRWVIKIRRVATCRHRDESGPVIATPPSVVVAVAPPSRRVVIGETMARGREGARARSLDRSTARSTARPLDGWMRERLTRRIVRRG